MAEPDEKKLVLPSSFEQMEQIQPFVNKLQEWAGFDDENFNRIMLALSEAVNNAIIHGNNQNRDKNAYINARFNNRVLTVSVRDEGDGFDPDNIPDPLKEENLLNEGGRGIYLMKQYADNVTFSQNGKMVTLDFHIDQ